MATPYSDYEAIYSQMFAATFESEYQAVGRLGNVLAPAHKYMNVNDNKVNVPQSTPIDMVPLTSFQADLASLNTTVRNKEISFEQRYVKQTVGRMELPQFHPNAINMIINQQAKALQRYEDSKIINALNASGNTPISAPSNMTTEIFTKARAQLGKNNVTGNLYMLMHWNNFEALLGDTQFTSNLFNKEMPLNNPGVSAVQFLDFTILRFGDVLDAQTGENIGLPLNSGVRTCFAFSDTSLIFGSQVEAMPEVTYVPQNLRYEIVTASSLGASVYDAKGIVPISCTE